MPTASRYKIAHVTTVDLSLRYLLLNQLRRIQAEGYEVMGISAPGPDLPVLRDAGIAHLPVPLTRRITPFRDLYALWRLYRWMRVMRFDLVHTHTPKAGLLGQLAARWAGVPVVVNTLHGFYFHEHMRPLVRRVYVWLERVAARCSDLILSQNREDIDTAIREGIASEAILKPLGNGIDVTRFDPARVGATARAATRRSLGIADDQLVVGFVGRLVEEKGVLDLFEAARQLLDLADLRVVFVGPYDLAKPDAIAASTAASHGVADRCIFTGLRQDMPELYAAMDVLALPSHREGFPRAPMEAAAMGIPCVATDIRGCREAVLQDTNGLLVPLRDPAALSTALRTLLTDRALRERLGRQGRQLALERFDERKVFDTVLAEYARLLEGRAPRNGGREVE